MKAHSPIRALLSQLVDYAGLFPPAGLDMAAAVRNYASYLSGEYSWMLGRFIVPAGKIEEFRKAASPFLAESEWKVGVLGKPSGKLIGGGLVVDAIELRAERIKDIHSVSSVDTYFEVPVAAPSLESTLEAIARADARAKIRTGGLTAEAFPEAGGVARFLSLCHRTGIAFKATAGLHHPVRGAHPFTYDPASASGMMHGFLNVFLAAILIFAGAEEQEAALLLEERSLDAFRFDDESVRWQSWRLTTEQIQKARESFAISFGSCSFQDPVRELGALGLL